MRDRIADRSHAIGQYDDSETMFRDHNLLGIHAVVPTSVTDEFNPVIVRNAPAQSVTSEVGRGDSLRPRFRHWDNGMGLHGFVVTLGAKNHVAVLVRTFAKLESHPFRHVRRARDDSPCCGHRVPIHPWDWSGFFQCRFMWSRYVFHPA